MWQLVRIPCYLQGNQRITKEHHKVVGEYADGEDARRILAVLDKLNDSLKPPQTSNHYVRKL